MTNLAEGGLVRFGILLLEGDPGQQAAGRLDLRRHPAADVVKLHIQLAVLRLSKNNAWGEAELVPVRA